MRQQIQAANSGMRLITLRVREWLRRVMPRVAIVAAALFVLMLALGETRIYGEHVVGTLLELITSCVVFFTILYYGIKALRWLTQRLLWRVRRRLVITYLFVGLTPIVLFCVLGFLFAMIGAGQAMSRIVAVEMSGAEQRALASARSLADEIGRLSPNADDRAIQAWLDERTAQLQTSLPGARTALWRSALGSGGDPVMLGSLSPAQFTSGPDGEDTRGVGTDQTPADAPLPAWLQGRAEWSGLAYFPPSADATSPRDTPAVRALVRGETAERAAALLITVPISRAFVRQLEASTGVDLQPFFTGPQGLSDADQNRRR